MSRQEELFFEWWDRVERYISSINLRQAWDAGYEAAMDEMKK